jgi:hypothetical protein
MAQVFEFIVTGESAQASLDKVGTALGTIRSNFSGTSFPASPPPVAGQPCWRTDLQELYVYNGTSWAKLAFANGPQPFIAASSNTVLTAAQSGSLVYVTSSSVVTMPSSPPAGTWFDIMCDSGGADVSAAESMSDPDGLFSGTGAFISAEGTLTLKFTGTIWLAFALRGPWMNPP